MVTTSATFFPDSLRQGEVFSDLREPKIRKALESDAVAPYLIDWDIHDYAILITPDCDLVGDHYARIQASNPDGEAEARRLARQLDYVLCCPLFTKEEIRTDQRLRREIWKRIEENRTERYFTTRMPEIENLGSGLSDLPNLYSDFNRTFMLPTLFLYQEIQEGGVSRKGVLPFPWGHKIVERWSNYSSRICLPDPNDNRVANR